MSNNNGGYEIPGLTQEAFEAALADGPFDRDGLLCPICLRGVGTREQKTAHLQQFHGYEPLDVRPQK